jgi:hypothetical protein
MTKIFKIIFYNRFPTSAIIPKSEYILALGGKSITNHLNNLALYISKINLEFGRELQSIIESREKYLSLQ